MEEVQKSLEKFYSTQSFPKKSAKPTKRRIGSTHEPGSGEVSTEDQTIAEKIAKYQEKEVEKNEETKEENLTLSRSRNEFRVLDSECVPKKIEEKERLRGMKDSTIHESGKQVLSKSDDVVQDYSDGDVSDSEVDNASDPGTDDEVVSTSCEKCAALAKAVCPQVRSFIKSLMSFADGGQEPVEIEETTKVHFLRPIPIPAGVKQVEISSGSGLYLSKPAKAKMLTNCNSDPYKLARSLLVALYGNQIKADGVSAKGKGTKAGIEESSLLAMYEFIKKNANTENPPGNSKDSQGRPAFTYPVFIKELNRKMTSSRRLRKSSSQKKKVAVDDACDSGSFTKYGDKERKPALGPWNNNQCPHCGKRCKTGAGVGIHVRYHCKMRPALECSSENLSDPEQSSSMGNDPPHLDTEITPDPLDTARVDPFEVLIVKVESVDNPEFQDSN